MGIRQKLNDNPALSSAAAVLILLGAAALIISMYWKDFGESDVDQAFFTVDDGNNWFLDDASRIPPFNRDGKMAYRAKVFQCPDGHRFVGYLERYGDAERQRLETAAAKSGGKLSANALYTVSLEVRRPGEQTWTKNTPETLNAYQEIMSPKCPTDPNAIPKQVYPE